MTDDKQAKRAAKKQEKRTRALDYLGSVCTHCGTTDGEVLTFQPKPGEVLGFQISQKLENAWDSLWPELDKCYLACRSCHANGGIPSAAKARDAETQKTAQTDEQSRKAAFDASVERLGRTIRAEEGVQIHNAWIDALAPREACGCDYCEIVRDGEELPREFKERVPELKAWDH